jgi:phospholipid/cholesterol/gamma-HCH transport system substrate-binding protein
MASLKTKFRVGVFVVLGFIVTFVAVVWLGLSHHLEKGRYYVAYFDESVQGLNKDSPVKYRGVSIGRVGSISVAPDATLVEVVLKIDPEVKPDENFVAQLRAVGITGIMFVELDRRKRSEADLSPRIGFPSKYPIIPTKPSEIQQIISEITDVLQQLKSLELGHISDKVKKILDGIDRTVDEIRVGELTERVKLSLDVWDRTLNSVESAAGSLNALSLKADGTVSELRDILRSNKQDLSDAVTALNQAMLKAGGLMRSGSHLVGNADERIQHLSSQLMVTLQKIDRTADKLNRVIDQISDQPSQLLFGKPLPTRHTPDP